MLLLKSLVIRIQLHFFELDLDVFLTTIFEWFVNRSCKNWNCNRNFLFLSQLNIETFYRRHEKTTFSTCQWTHTTSWSCWFYHDSTIKEVEIARWRSKYHDSLVFIMCIDCFLMMWCSFLNFLLCFLLYVLCFIFRWILTTNGNQMKRRR